MNLFITLGILATLSVLFMIGTVMIFLIYLAIKFIITPVITEINDYYFNNDDDLSDMY